MNDSGVQRLTPRTWGRVLSLLDEALQRPEAEREGWLASVDPALRPALRELLAAREALENANFLSALPALSPPGVAGGAVGPWALLRKLGEGGMASVWLAERSDGAHRRQVALKLPWLGPHAPVLGERFARERQLLSSLEHPNIAALLDAGTDAGQPWLAMEYVEGVPLLQWADEQGLDPRARVTLFLQVLSAVQYAHSRLVIHRDVKPANVLVDARGQVKLLDFGVAKLLDEDGEAVETRLTRLGGRALTPQYASPEQLAGQPLATTSDVYSLGLLLYELLCTRRPYTLERNGLAAMERTVREARIQPPSELADPARAHALRGDLDGIVLKALALDPRQRFPSAEAFARELTRHLA